MVANSKKKKDEDSDDDYVSDDPDDDSDEDPLDGLDTSLIIEGGGRGGRSSRKRATVNYAELNEKLGPDEEDE